MLWYGILNTAVTYKRLFLYYYLILRSIEKILGTFLCIINGHIGLVFPVRLGLIN